MQHTAAANILAVDDSKANLALLVQVLNNAGFMVRPMLDGAAALESVKVELPDLILLDVKMPDLDGYEVCRILKVCERTKDVPVIFVSAEYGTFDKVKAFGVGAVDYITKPIQVDELLARINTHLKIRNLTLELQTSNQNLKNLLSDLKTAQQQLIHSEKMAALGRMVMGVAHELRNPLNFVLNYAAGSIELSQELLEILQPVMQSVRPEVSANILALIEDLQENATTIEKNSRRAEAIIKSMMQHTPHTNAEQLKHQPTRLHDVLDEAVKLVNHSKQSQHAGFSPSVETKYQASSEIIDAFPDSLLRAFINLIDNAWDAMWHKKTSLQTDPALSPAADYTPRLLISTRTVVDKVEIVISDNGCGVDTEIQSKILDPFFTTKSPKEGVGLGLSITYDIITKQHQGELKFETKPGEFTNWIITLPQSIPTADGL